jgi:hypothetical protein
MVRTPYGPQVNKKWFLDPLKLMIYRVFSFGHTSNYSFNLNGVNTKRDHLQKLGIKF